ncbi:MAG: SusC/RagA family TonB-linked outer membrane protein, partial [Cytophagaceae bacterium]
MRKRLAGFWLLCVLFALPALAQDRTVTGKVTSSDDGSTLPGVSIQLKGTSRGTTTDSEGNYSLTNVPADARLVFSFIGTATQEIVVGNQSTLNVQLKADASQLSEVVVTAQGIERDRRSLGYSTQDVRGDVLAQRSEPNVLNALQGKLAGVNITGASGAPGASTNINIRGITSFNGSNQPLIVVDGIIFSNDLNQTENTLFGSQPANRLADVNPESIESINVLKGPAAAVLYGSRASAGAIIITTKTGRNMKGKTEVTVNSSYNIQNVYGLAELQNDYGQGTQNNFVNNTANSWGPKFGGALTQVTNTQNQVVPYQAYPNNVKDFFRQGGILQNSVNIASGDERRNFILAIGNTLQHGVIPNTKFNRTNVQVGGESRLNNGIKINGTVTYVQTVQNGVPGGNGGSAFGQLTRIPRSFDLAGRPYQTPQGKSIYYSLTQNHPLWSAYNETLQGQVDRVFGNIQIGYDITKWLNISYRATADTYTDRRKFFTQIGAARTPAGAITEDIFFRSELNGDLIITAQKDNLFLEGLNANLLLGNNMNQRKTQNPTLTSQQLTIPGFENVSNGAVFSSSTESSTMRRLLGYYGQLSLGYQNYVFLELTGRVDQSSTLPKANNTYFYPSAALSFVPTDAFKLNSNVLSYAKVRASIAKVGRDADPYLLTSVYVPSSLGNNAASVTFPVSIGGASLPGFGISSRIGNANLTPEFVRSYEFGLNLGLFRNRASIDFAYFDSRSTNQIFNVSVSNSSGYDTRTTNVGSMRNRGIELVLNTTPVRLGSGFKWDLVLNFTRIRNKVEEIAPGVTQSPITGNAFTGINPSIVVGQPYGVIVGTANARSPQGQYLINPNTGAFVPGIAGQVIANPNPNWTAGLTNTFSYKGLSLSVAFNAVLGNKINFYGIGRFSSANGRFEDNQTVDQLAAWTA